jgi:hypothetical protein
MLAVRKSGFDPPGHRPELEQARRICDNFQKQASLSA